MLARHAVPVNSTAKHMPPRPVGATHASPLPESPLARQPMAVVGAARVIVL